ncbi:hypothetical protein EJ05DRAFT_508718 [Pseudovirgaria hyperparasitica]|uniref:DNA polymerase V n=1 Tax=Pseudovirgaria hyperparasitica TaxID=470096 RepID=A0A6A6WE53_9PEZI|nr:uncharacterized protein EJ05DRAFT_508718 [Pseudovirgaria hyperparasitica]KAF2760146.1 hypothetical protein EJ05DRAFT_508718 [Pseudovirgaria hyperparasitica]
MGTKRKQNADTEKPAGNLSEKRQKKAHQNGHAESSARPAVNGSAAPGKKKSVYSEADAELANLLDNLASEDSETRLKAAKDLLRLVDTKTQNDNALIEKVLRRLTRGLGSNRKSARIGFSLVLTELVSQLYGSVETTQAEVPWNLSEFIRFVVNQTSPTGDGENKEEKQSLLLGQAFGLSAILQSSAAISLEHWSAILEYAFEIAKTTPNLRENAGLMLCDAAKNFDKVKDPSPYIQKLMEGMNANDMLKTPEGVAIWIAYKSKFGDSELPPNIWHENDPLCSKERHTLAQVMRENFKDTVEKVSANGSQKKTQSGYARSAPSFAWDVVLMSALSVMDEVEFKKFWKQIVDQNMFTNTSTPKRKSCGLQIFMNMLKTAPVSSLKAIFSPNLMRCIINQCQEPDRMLHAAAKSALKEVSSRVHREPESARIIVPELMTHNGSLDFDRVTKSKTVENCLKHADHGTLSETTEFLESKIVKPAAEEATEAETQRHIAGDLLLNIIRQRTKPDFEEVEPMDSWYLKTLQVLAKFAYFRPSETATKHLPSPPLVDADRSLLKDRTLSCLTHLISQGVTNVGTIAFQLVAFISRTAEDEKQEFIFQASKDITKSLKKAHKMLKNIDKESRKAKGGASASSLNALKLLGSMSVLQVYNGDPDAVSILDELKQCYESITEGANATSDGFDVLFELILSFAARPSALSRSLSEQVFSAFAADLTPQSLASMTAILDTSETVSGQKELFQQDASDMDDEASDSDAASIDGAAASDVEMLSDNDDAQSSDSAVSASDDDDDNEDEAAEFNRKFALALGTTPFDPNRSRSASPASSASSLDSDAMLATDAALSSIFAQRAKAAGPTAKPARQRRDARATVLNFKNRVLDLLLLFVKRERSSPLALALIPSLLRCIRSTSSPQLSNKAFTLLKTYADGAKGRNQPVVDTQDAKAGLLAVHAAVRRPGDAGAGVAARWLKACSLASLLFCRLLVAKGVQFREEVAMVYLQTMLQGKPRVAPSFYHEFDNWMLSLEVVV